MRPGKEYRDSLRAGRRGWVLGDGLCVPLNANARQARLSRPLDYWWPLDYDSPVMKLVNAGG